jgi:hypothetical protein
MEVKYNIMVARFPYAGNGGYEAEAPDVGDWLGETIHKMRQDPRIGEIYNQKKGDTPITMMRNRAIYDAKRKKVDAVLMIDSDMVLDLYVGEDPSAKPFWDTAWEFFCKNYHKGPHAICAPYCGPPPGENVYCFKWARGESNSPNDDWSLTQYTREEAAYMTGVHPVAAQPTGLILFDTRCFEYEDDGGLICAPWFDYEYTDKYQTAKGSTEDVMCTRNISINGIVRNGYNPLYCAWDSWAGHIKPKIVGKPTLFGSDQVAKQLVSAVNRGIGRTQKIKPVNRFELGIQTPPRDLDRLAVLISRWKKAMDRPIQVVEVGSWVGASSLAIAEMLDDDDVLWCVDTWEGTSLNDPTGVVAKHYGSDALFQTWAKNTKDHPNCMPVRATSQDAAARWSLPVDIIYIDGDHSYEAVKADIEAWSKHLVPDGVISGHDWQMESVRKAVGECLGEVHSAGTIWAGRPRRTEGGSGRPEAGDGIEGEDVSQVPRAAPQDRFRAGSEAARRVGAVLPRVHGDGSVVGDDPDGSPAPGPPEDSS